MRLLINMLTSFCDFLAVPLVTLFFPLGPLRCLLLEFLCERRFLIRLPDFSITLSAAFFPTLSPA